MASSSYRWLWAQCLVGSGLLFLLAHITLPAPEDRPLVEGKVTGVTTISRKGLGSSYELHVRTADQGDRRVLIARSIAPESSANGLVGKQISAHVNWSDEATDFKAPGAGIDEAAIAKAVERASTTYEWLATVLAGAGMFIGLCTLWGRIQP